MPFPVKAGHQACLQLRAKAKSLADHIQKRRSVVVLSALLGRYQEGTKFKLHAVCDAELTAFGRVVFNRRCIAVGGDLMGYGVVVVFGHRTEWSRHPQVRSSPQPVNALGMSSDASVKVSRQKARTVRP